MAWVAAHMLAEDPLPSWAGGRRVVAVGGQTDRPVDDVAAVTDVGGWVTIQAKKGLRVERREDGGLGEALRQLVEIDSVGVPDGVGGDLRPVDPDRDLVLILSDDSAARTVNANLFPVVNRLRTLPLSVPVDEMATTEKQQEALRILKGHLGRCWKARSQREMTDGDFRRLTAVLSVRALYIAEDGEDLATTRVRLRDLGGDDAEGVRNLWSVLGTVGQGLAEERAYLDRRGLVRLLDDEYGIVLRPLARLRSDIDRLKAVSDANVGLLGDSVSISTPDGPVRVVRPVEPALLTASGNLAVTGVPGSGKTVLLHRLATVAGPTHDLVVLRSDDLRSGKAGTRAELRLTHDLSEVLEGWTGTRPGLVLIDGIDQARGPDAPVWLPRLASDLSRTRWRIVATIRSFDLKYGDRWKSMFPGCPVDPGATDPDLARVRHLMVGDLTFPELATVSQASPRLGALLDEAGPRLRVLLANPFNLDLAAQLLSEDATDFSRIHSRAELLDQYWRKRVGRGPAALNRTRTLRVIVSQMLAGGRQAVDPADLPAEVAEEAYLALHHNGILRETPVRPGHALAPVGFMHPVLFDYAVAMLALGEASRPTTLADVLDTDPNLALVVRPSLEYRLALAWASDDDRTGFWRLALRLASLTAGHPIAASEAARVGALEMNDTEDLRFLGDAATGAVSDPAGLWGDAEARVMAFLLAVAVARHPDGPAKACIDALTCKLARSALATDDINLAGVAAQLPVRVQAGSDQDYAWTAAAASDCMTVALKDRADPRKAALAGLAGQLLALAARGNPDALTQVIEAVIAPESLRAWGMTVMRHLTRIIPDIIRQSPETAIRIGLAPWNFEDERRSPTPFLPSAITGMTSNFQQDVDLERHSVGTDFPKIMRADPLAGTTLLFRILNRPGMYLLPAIPEMREPPHVRQGSPLAFSGGHQVLPAMVDEFARQLNRLAEDEAASIPDSNQQPGTAKQIVNMLVQELQHGEAWKRLLYQAATAPSAALATSLLPALSTPSLYAYHETWAEAAHVARRAAEQLAPEELAQIRAAVDGITDAGTSPTQPQYLPAYERRRAMILSALVGQGAEESPPELDGAVPAARLPALPQLGDPSSLPFQVTWESDTLSPGSIQELARKIDEQLDRPAHADEDSEGSACATLENLWDELDNLGNADPGLQELGSRIASRLADCPNTTPDSPLGTRVFAIFLAATPDADSEAGAEETGNAIPHSWESSLTASWPVTAATTGAKGLVRLYHRDLWRSAHGQLIREKLSLLLDSPDPVLRLIAVDALPVMFSTREPLLNELERRLTSETDGHIATRLMRILADQTHRHPGEVDGMLHRLAALPQWTVLTASAAGDQQIGAADQGSIAMQILAVLAAVHDTPYAQEVLRTWLTAPGDHPGRATGALHCLGDLLNPADPQLRKVQERLFNLIRVGVTQVSTAIQAPDEPVSDDRRVSADDFADHLARQLYFASGAFDKSQPNPAPKPRGDMQQFARLALPVLDALSSIHQPRITINIVQTAEHIAPAAPKQALLIAVKAVTKDPAYWRESLGIEAALQLIRRLAADHRDMLLGDDEATAAVRHLLESFIRLGWAQAIELAEDLDELFR